MRISKLQNEEEKAEVKKLTCEEPTLQSADILKSDANCDEAMDGFICNKKVEESCEKKTNDIGNTLLALSDRINALEKAGSTALEDVKGVKDFEVVKPAPQLETTASAPDTPHFPSSTPLPPQVFDGQWKECYEVGMKVNLLTATRGRLPATITHVHPSSYGRESCDLKLDNGDTVRDVSTIFVKFPSDYSKKIQGVAPKRVHREPSKVTGGVPTDPTLAESKPATPAAALTLQKNEKLSDLECMFGVIMMTLIFYPLLLLKCFK